MDLPERAAQIDLEARELSGAADAAGSGDKRAFFAALIAMNDVNTRLSSVRWAVEKHAEGFIPPETIEEAWERRIGICGTQTVAFIHIMQALEIPVRDVQVYWLSQPTGILNNHIFPEVFWADRWRMFDVTWGWYPHTIGTPLDPLCYDDIYRLPYTYEKATASTLPWTTHYVRYVDIYEPLEADLVGILYDGGGEISPPSKHIAESHIEFDLTSLPTALGMTHSHAGHLTELTYCLDLPPGKWDIQIEFRPNGENAGKGPQLKLITKKSGKKIKTTVNSADTVSAQKLCAPVHLSISTKRNDIYLYRFLEKITAQRCD